MATATPTDTESRGVRLTSIIVLKGPELQAGICNKCVLPGGEVPIRG